MKRRQVVFSPEARTDLVDLVELMGRCAAWPATMFAQGCGLSAFAERQRSHSPNDSESIIILRVFDRGRDWSHEA